MHSLPVNYPLAVFSPQQNLTNSLALSYHAFCILFWSAGLFFWLLFINNYKAKNSSLANKAKPHQFVCFFVFRGLTFSAEGNLRGCKCKVQHHWKGQSLWLTSESPSHIMHLRSLFEVGTNLQKSSALSSIIFELFLFFFLKSLLSKEKHTDLICCSLFSQYCFLN